MGGHMNNKINNKNNNNGNNYNMSLIHSERALKNNVETKKVDLSPPRKLLRGRLGDGAQK